MNNPAFIQSLVGLDNLYSLKILFIEDSISDRAVYKKLLAKDSLVKFDITEVETLKEAVSVLKKEEFDAILLDLVLPDSDESKTFKTVSTLVNPNTIIILTSNDDQEAAFNFLKQEAGAFLVKKEISGSILSRTIFQVILKYRSFNFIHFIMEAMPFGLDIIDQEGTILFANKLLQNLVGKPIIGKKCWELYPDSKQKCPDCFIDKEYKLGYFKSSTLHNMLNGCIFNIVHVGINFNGKIASLRIFNDITAAKKAEEELLNAKGHIEKADQLKVLGRMISGLLHNLNNSLTPIVGFMDIIKIKYLKGLDSRLAKILSAIETSAHNTIDIIENIKSFYKAEDKAVKNSVNINNIIQQAIEISKPKWESEAIKEGKEIKIKTNLAKNMPIIMGYPGEIRNMIINLLFNAVDAIEVSGSVSISTSVEENNIKLIVKDNGKGMPENVKQMCFNPFFTTKGASGTGMGLATVISTIDEHLGAIEIKSKENKGTSFIIRIPVVSKKEESRIIKRIKGKKTVNNISVLVVGNDMNTNNTIRKVLENEGYDLSFAADAINGMIKTEGREFNFVITDRQMLGMNAETFAKAIKIKNNKTGFILMVNLNDLEEIKSNPSIYMDGLLVKPVTKQKLKNTIRDVFQYYN